MKKWEYRRSVDVGCLNEWGEEGWELVCSVPNDYEYTLLVFKRELNLHMEDEDGN